MLTARLNALSFAAVLIASNHSAFPADPAPTKSLFVVQVQTLRPIAKSEPQPAPKLEGKAETKPDRSGDTDKSDFSIESGIAKEIPIESRAQQIEAMNGTPLLRSSGGARSTSSSSGMKRTIDLLLPPGKSLLSKNPNARRDPLRILEE